MSFLQVQRDNQEDDIEIKFPMNVSDTESKYAGQKMKKGTTSLHKLRAK